MLDGIIFCYKKKKGNLTLTLEPCQKVAFFSWFDFRGPNPNSKFLHSCQQSASSLSVSLFPLSLSLFLSPARGKNRQSAAN